MNELLVLSLIVSIFAFNAFCMNPSNWKPPAPEGVIFGECFFVPGITGGEALLDEIHYSYRHICRQTFADDRSQPPEHELNWYVVGSLKSDVTQSQNLPPNHYAPPFEQFRIQFIFLRGMTVKFALKITNDEFEVTFQSAQQRQAFYKMIYHNVTLIRASLNTIGVLHEISMREDGTVGPNRKIGNNIEALCQGIDSLWYITFTEQGEPVLIFSQAEATITRLSSRLFNKLQLLLLAHGTYYILTFPNCIEAEQFSDALLGYVAPLPMKNIDTSIRNRLRFNSITMDS